MFRVFGFRFRVLGFGFWVLGFGKTKFFKGLRFRVCCILHILEIGDLKLKHLLSIKHDNACRTKIRKSFILLAQNGIPGKIKSNRGANLIRSLLSA